MNSKIKKKVNSFLLLSIMLFTIMLAILYIGQNLLYDRERCIWNFKTNIIDNYEYYNYENIIIGSSRAFALDPRRVETLTGKSYINLSTGGSEVTYVYYALKRILDKGVNIKNVYINIPPNNNIKTSLDTSYGERFIRWFVTKREASELDKYKKGTLDKYNNTRFLGDEYIYSDFFDLFKKIKMYILTNVTYTNMTNTLKESKGFFVTGKNDELDFKKVNKTCAVKSLLKYRLKIKDLTLNNASEINITYTKKTH